MSIKKLFLLCTTASFTLASSMILAGSPDMMSSSTSSNMTNTTMLGNGFYAGLGGSYVFGSSETGFNGNPKTTIGSNGFGGQLVGGYDALISSQFYVGGQGFFGFYSANTHGDITATTGKLSLNYLWGGIAEPGYHLASNANLFVRMGVVGGDATVENTSGTSSSFTKIGYALGAGSEIGITNNIGIRGQYTFYGLAHEDIIGTSVSPFFGEALMSVIYHFA